MEGRSTSNSGFSWVSVSLTEMTAARGKLVWTSVSQRHKETWYCDPATDISTVPSYKGQSQQRLCKDQRRKSRFETANHPKNDIICRCWKYWYPDRSLPQTWCYTQWCQIGSVRPPQCHKSETDRPCMQMALSTTVSGIVAPGDRETACFWKGSPVPWSFLMG